MSRSKYIMSRMSMSLGKLRFVETRPMRLLHSITLDKVDYMGCIIYLNKDKTNALVYLDGVFGISKQKPINEIHKDDIPYNVKYLDYKDGISMLKLMIRGDKLKKIKKKINADTTK